jgi:hypothetical protein
VFPGETKNIEYIEVGTKEPDIPGKTIYPAFLQKHDDMDIVL